MSNWIEVSLRVDGEAAEAIADVLQRYGHQGVVIEQDDIPPDTWDEGDVPPPQHLTLRAYFPDDERAPHTKAQLESALGHMAMLYPMPEPAYQVIHEADWAEAWKVHYKPVRIGRRILIRPEWIEVTPRPDEIVIALDPGMAFGTGTHPTTQLCLQALEDLVTPGLDVFDLGTGTGILALAAARLGAAKVLAVDNDPVAVRAAEHNIARNGGDERITVQTGSLASVLTSSRRFDLVIVNILAKIIIPMCDAGLGQTVRPGGRAIFSGLIETQTEEVEAALRRTGLTPTARRRMGDWMLLEAQRPSS